MFNTINGEAVMQQVRQGTVPPYWHVFPAKVSHFLKNIAVCAVFTLLLFGFLLYLMVHPEFAIGLRGAVEMPELHAFWRMLDFIVVGIAMLILLIFLFSEVWKLGTAHKQALVLLPEGFVMQKGATRRSVTAIHYGAIFEITTSVSNNTWFLVMPLADGYGTIKLELDGRFGPSSEISSTLEQAHLQYVMAMDRASY